MNLQAIFLEFNSLMIQDEEIHQKILADILLSENLRYESSDYRQFCLGKSDRDGLTELLGARGRVISEAALTKLLTYKTDSYLQQLNSLEELTLESDLKDFLEQLKQRDLTIGIVTGAQKQEVEFFLDKTGISPYFSLIISGEVLKTSKPDPESYLLALEYLQLSPNQCLAIENTFIGIEAAKRAKIPVVGLTKLYPLHLLQRRANWTVDYLTELELDRLEQIYQKNC